ncbi:agrin-like [Uloborus diversus]|uniref:agrin-like n=1 Tax=Uloborus diversus TaxID=327109 RepID=UPI0024094465|nr:agrin-like [Uloborus diversus]
MSFSPRLTMVCSAFFLLLWNILEIAQGQVDTSLYDPGFDYQNSPINEDDDSLMKEYLPVQSPQEQRFLNGLIIEAGRHVLFPQLYLPKEAEQSVTDKKPSYYEIKGQPEVVETYMDRKTRGGRLDCPEECPVYKPVCGNDGKVYQSECHLMRENCGVANVSTGTWDKCRGKHYLCPARCLDISDPVCGSDGRIYHNICVLRKRNCGKLIQAMPVRKCYDRVRQAKTTEECPDSCLEIYKPVCGSNGVIYYNECFMKMRTCREGIVSVEMDSCVRVPKCPEVCLPIYDPVCGSDAKLYINQCRMMQQNCGQDVKNMPRSFCDGSRT